MGRRSIWSNPEILKQVKKFVPAGDEVWRLQNDSDPECVFFRRMVRGSDRPSRGTMQGTYIFAPGGQLLGAINTYSPKSILDMMDRALERFAKLPKSARRLTNPDLIRPKFRWEDSYPKHGLVLIRTARDLPKDGDPKSEKASGSNRDSVWFTKQEARMWLPETLEVGAVGAGSRAIASRLAQFVFVDNVRGQTLPYHDEEVMDAAVKTTITAIAGDLVTISIRIETRATTKGEWRFGDNYWKPSRKYPRSISTWGIGTATYDRKTASFTKFEVVSLGHRSGYTGNNGRGKGSAMSPIGFVLQQAPRTWRVAPTFINVYNADWVKHPSKAR